MATNKRKNIPNRTRFEVFKRDSFKCQYCGSSSPEVALQVDHIVPVAKGGTNDLLNLVTSCWECNSGKSDKKLDDNTEIEKQRRMLDELNEKRQQLEMMMEWRNGITNIDDDKLSILIDKWESETDFIFAGNVPAERKMKLLIKRYDFNVILDAIETCSHQYLQYANGRPIAESVQKAFDMVERVIKRTLNPMPEHERQFYYIRGIMRNRYPYVDDLESIRLLREGYEDGLTLEELKSLVIESLDWFDFQRMMNDRGYM